MKKKIFRVTPEISDKLLILIGQFQTLAENGVTLEDLKISGPKFDLDPHPCILPTGTSSYKPVELTYIKREYPKMIDINLTVKFI